MKTQNQQLLVSWVIVLLAMLAWFVVAKNFRHFSIGVLALLAILFFFRNIIKYGQDP